MPDPACASRQGARFGAFGRGGKADRAAGGGDRIDRNCEREDGGSLASACAIGVGFWRSLFQRCRGFKFFPRGLGPHDSKVPPMSGFATARQKMVDGQVRPSDVTDIRILDAMLAVPREAFVPENQRALAYLDLDLDISEGASAKRFLIRPAVTAKMLQAAEIKDTDKVLVAGCATGYTAAVVESLAGQVIATETGPAQA